MPDHATHHKDDAKLGFSPMEHVHRFMDKPVTWLGRGHRVLNHSYTTCLLLGLLYGPEAAAASYAHLLRDGAASTRDPMARLLLWMLDNTPSGGKG